MAKKKAKKTARRTVLYSSAGKKLYAVRDAQGRFKDIQQYSRAHRMDIQRGSTAEVTAAKKKAAKQAAKKVVKKVVKKAVKRVVKKVVKRKAAKKKAAKR